MAKKKKSGKSSVSAKLQLWQERLSLSDAAYEHEISKADQREALYNGSATITPIVDGDKVVETKLVRNIVFENIETQISSSIPMPKVTAVREEDEHLATIIEHLLRNEMNRLPMETINDMAERTVPIQGGVLYLIEWDNTVHTHNTVGAVTIRLLHPKQLAPQPGVYTSIDDMDWIIVKIPTTKEQIRRQYDKDVLDEGESEPELRGPGAATSEDAVTEYIGFERNEHGGINRYVWVNDIELEDLENYQARRQPVCTRCGHVQPLPGQLIFADVDPTLAGETTPDRTAEQAAGAALSAEIAAAPEGEVLRSLNYGKGEEPEPERYDGGPCPYCGNTEFTSQEQEYERVFLPIKTANGVEIDGARPGLDENGRPVLQPTLIPFYKPDSFPVILQKNVSKYGQLLGSSDCDIMETQQNTTNRLTQKILDKLLQAGTAVTLPANTKFVIDPKDSKTWRVADAAEKNLISTYEFTGDVTPEMAFLHETYEQSRQMLGITDSFQGRKDTTATSGRAKEFSASQAAGRMESKRVMKYAAYADIYERIFNYYLAYSDEPRPLLYKNAKGETAYEEFNRYDFLAYDEAGVPYWKNQFLFSCDSSETLANNREAMWHEMLNFLSIGAFGDPHTPEALVLFWTKMEELHYPGAGKTKQLLEEKLEAQQAAEAQMQQAQMIQEQPEEMPPEIPMEAMEQF